VPATRDGLGPFYRDVIAVSPLERGTPAIDPDPLRTLRRLIDAPLPLFAAGLY
jgi:hypothetical protein